MSDLLSDKVAARADRLDSSSIPSTPKCTDSLRVTRAEPWTVNSGGWCLLSYEPKLRFHINQGILRDGSNVFPTYNIWSPGYFGISIPRSELKPYKLSSNDLVVTRYEDDIACLKADGTGPIPFEIGNLVGGIDIDYPGFLCCKCCFRYRGWVTLGDSERWRFDEINESHYRFQRVHEHVDNKEYPRSFPKTLIWERFSDWTMESFGKAPADVPFNMDQNTRLCRVNPDPHCDPSILVAPVIAMMNRDSLAFIDGLSEAHQIETSNLGELVLMTALAVAKFERSTLEG